jgi:hypothetical protein
VAHNEFMKGPRLGSPLMLAFFAVLIACGSTEPKSNLLVFEGTITDISTGAPISGASVAFGDGSGFGFPAVWPATTDAAGNYTLSENGCVRSPYLYAAATRYYLTSKPVRCDVERQTVNFALTRDPQAP